MLRRRSKTAKIQKHATPGPAPQNRSRRRARPDVPVPPHLHASAKPPAAVEQPRSGVREQPPVRAESRPRDRVVLVSGFEPFGGERTNPSWDVAARLPREIAGLRVETTRVPCEFRRSIEVLAEAIDRHRPELVIMLGQAGGRSRIGVERVAINVDDARIADNAGAQPLDEAIAPNGPPAYFSSLPVKAMVGAIRAAGVPAELSNTAGTYVCNHVMYGVLHFLAASGRKARAGFVHLPYAEEQVVEGTSPGMAIESMVKGIVAGIAAAATHARDVGISEGQES